MGLLEDLLGIPPAAKGGTRAGIMPLTDESLPLIRQAYKDYPRIMRLTQAQPGGVGVTTNVDWLHHLHELLLNLQGYTKSGYYDSRRQTPRITLTPTANPYTTGHEALHHLGQATGLAGFGPGSELLSFLTAGLLGPQQRQPKLEEIYPRIGTGEAVSSDVYQPGLELLNRILEEAQKPLAAEKR